MTARWPARLLRRWVGLYTRGLPVDVGGRRREEIEADLWSQLEEAGLMGRSDRETSGEILVRLIAGIPADVSWRLAHRTGERVRAKIERDTPSGMRASEALAILGGLSFALYIALLVVLGITTPHLRIDDVYEGSVGMSAGVLAIVLGGGGIIVIAIATIGLVLQFQERIHPVVAVTGSIGASGGLLGAFGNLLVILVFLASAIVAWDLALTGILRRRLAAAHVVAAGLLLVPLAIAGGGAPLGALFVLAFPYPISFLAIGVAVHRGAPATTPPPGT